MADRYADLHSRKKNRKRGQISLMLVFFITSLLIVIIAAVLAPLGVQINSEFYAAGESIMLEANHSISQINNTDVKTEIQTTIGDALDSQQTNIEVNSAVFKYGWVFVLILAALVTFLYTRRLVEYGGTGFI